MKKTVSLILYIALSILIFVGCSDTNVVTKTFAVINNSDVEITDITLFVGSYFPSELERSRDNPNQIDLANGQRVEFSQLYDKRTHATGVGIITFRTPTPDDKQTNFNFDIDSDEDVTLTIDSSFEVSITGGNSYDE